VGPRRTAGAVLLFFISFVAAAQNSSLGQPFVDLSLVPGVIFPIAADRDLFSPGGGFYLTAHYQITGLPLLQVFAETGYFFLPVRAQSSLSFIPLGAGVEARVNLRPRWEIHGGISGGGFLGTLRSDPFLNAPETGYGAYLQAQLGISLYVAPTWSLGIAATFLDCFGLFRSGGALLGATYHLPAPGRSALSIEHVVLEPLFPIQARLYADKAPGTIIVKNQGRFPIRDIEASLLVRDYMGSPTTWKVPLALQSGELGEIQPRLRFNERVLGIIEEISLPAELTLRYSVAGRQHLTTRTFTLQLHDRNALTWDDDRKAALFMSEKDPLVLELAGRTASMARASALRPLNTAFRLAAGLHAELRAYGLSYAADPVSPYSALATTGSTVDFLKFPRQTLKQKAGDCDDLTVLFCSLLESVGLESAFITVPGHIFPAVCLGYTEAEAARFFASLDDLIFLDGRTWLPVEMTEIDGGFVQAWQAAARCWREHVPTRAAALYQTRETWKRFPPLSLAEGDLGLQYPEPALVKRLYEIEMERFLLRELEPKLAECRRRIESGGGAPAANALGVLYARYGLHSEAEAEFRRVLAREEYCPALTNLGNILFIRQAYAEALTCYERAEGLHPDNLAALLGKARTLYELGRFEEAQSCYRRLKTLDPELAGRYAYVALRGKSDERATATSGLDPKVLWEDE